MINLEAPKKFQMLVEQAHQVAREMFREAASYYADPEAQYHLGRLYLLGTGGPKDAIQAARWLGLSAKNGDHRAQALLGGMLFKGEEVARQAARGLFWLTLAKERAGPDESWITDIYASAFAEATDDFKKQGATIIGLTAGNIDRVAEFSKVECRDKFAVAADPGGKIAKTYDSIFARNPELSDRTSYVIAQDGKIAYAYSDLNPNDHVKNTMAAVQGLKKKG